MGYYDPSASSKYDPEMEPYELLESFIHGCQFINCFLAIAGFYMWQQR